MRFTECYFWQQEIIDVTGDCTIRGGRQDGKSWAVAKQITERCKKYPGSHHLILAATERQENFLLDKVVELIGPAKSNYKGRRTLTHLQLKDGGAHIWKFPVGQTGIYIEGLSSIDFIYVDEAIHVGRKVWDSVIPMLAEPKKRGLGWITLLSATRGRPKGYFFDSFSMDQFTKFVTNSERDAPHIDREFLVQEKKRLGDRMYGVIYNGDFDENAYKYFPKEIVMRNVRIKFFGKKDIKPKGNYYLGSDPARFGRSKAAFAVTEFVPPNKVRLIYAEEHAKSSLLDLRDRSIKLDEQFHRFRKHFIDPGGFGAGLVDILEEHFKYRLRELNNKSASLKLNKIFKEDLYSNLLRLLELDLIDIVNDPAIIKGLLDVELDEEEKIIGTDMSEAVVRACWASKEKNILTPIRSF